MLPASVPESPLLNGLSSMLDSGLKEQEDFDRETPQGHP
jgi:hypothetical protein